jgi:hypothetical protein
MPNNLSERGPLDAVYTATESGFIDLDVFTQYMERLKSEIEFQRIRRRQQPTKWRFPEIDIVFTDGHSSRYNMELLQELNSAGILLFRFPSHLTHLYQPLDLLFFSVLKKGLEDEVTKWMYERPGTRPTQFDVPEILKEAYYRASSLSNVISSWKRSNIYPFNKEGIVKIMRDRVLPTGERTERPLTQQQSIEEKLAIILPNTVVPRERTNRRVSLRKSGKAVLLTGPEATEWEAEDRLFKCLNSGKLLELQELCRTHGVADTGIIRILRRRLIPELKAKNLLSHTSEEQIQILLQKK